MIGIVVLIVDANEEAVKGIYKKLAEPWHGQDVIDQGLLLVDDFKAQGNVFVKLFACQLEAAYWLADIDMEGSYE